jgi:hypothetical protein
MVAKPPYEVEGYVGKKIHERKKGWTANPTAKTEL